MRRPRERRRQPEHRRQSSAPTATRPGDADISPEGQQQPRERDERQEEVPRPSADRVADERRRHRAQHGEDTGGASRRSASCRLAATKIHRRRRRGSRRRRSRRGVGSIDRGFPARAIVPSTDLGAERLLQDLQRVGIPAEQLRPGGVEGDDYLVREAGQQDARGDEVANPPAQDVGEGEDDEECTRGWELARRRRAAAAAARRSRFQPRTINGQRVVHQKLYNATPKASGFVGTSAIVRAITERVVRSPQRDSGTTSSRTMAR